jgi:ATP-binding cassette subfamily B protein
VRVDGNDIRRLSIEQYRKHIGIVLQEPFLVFGTIADNGGYGEPGASGMHIIEAARAARAHEFILKLPEGYDSLVGERGQSLSGGERQRIAIARALTAEPSVLICYEVTSWLDVSVQAAIIELLVQLQAELGVSMLFVTHNLALIRSVAHEVAVMNEGKIVEFGLVDAVLDDPHEDYTKQLLADTPALPASARA